MRSILSKIKDLARRAFRGKPTAAPPKPATPFTPLLRSIDYGVSLDRPGEEGIDLSDPAYGVALRELAQEGFDVLEMLGLENITEAEIEEVGEKATSPQEDRFLDNKLMFFVGSSNVRAARYDGTKGLLAVIFSSGCTYGYQGIDPNTALSFVRAPSKGKWVWAQLRNAGVPYKRI